VSDNNIKDMQPGPDMDRAIAVNIFGLKIDKHRDGWVQIGNLSTYPKRYSTDTAVAWEVLEKFPLVMVMRVEIFEGNITVEVTIYPDSDSEKSYTGSASTLPLAACRAALLAMNGGEGNEPNEG
jgi:hypothetical protein